MWSCTQHLSRVCLSARGAIPCQGQPLEYVSLPVAAGVQGPSSSRVRRARPPFACPVMPPGSAKEQRRTWPAKGQSRFSESVLRVGSQSWFSKMAGPLMPSNQCEGVRGGRHSARSLRPARSVSYGQRCWPFVRLTPRALALPAASYALSSARGPMVVYLW